MIRWFAKNDIATNLIMLGILFAGFFIALPSMPVEINPSYSYRSVWINFRARGITSEDIERLIVVPVEKRLDSVNGIKDVSSYSTYGRAKFYINAKENTNLAELKTEVESAVARLPSLPPDSEKPRVYIPDPNRWHEVISLMVTGEMHNLQLLAVGKQVRDDLLAIPGISAVKLQGKNTRRVYIEPDLKSLKTHELTLSDVSKAIRDNSIDLTAGMISSVSKGGIQVTAKNQAIDKEDFENIVIKTVRGAELKIKHIATVRDSIDQEEQKIFLFNGLPCLRVEVLRLKNESALEVSKLVTDYVKKQEGRFPEGVKLSIWDDESVPLNARVEILKDNLIQGAILVMIILTLFLRPSLAIFVVLGVPISFAGGLILMYYAGVSINMWTLFGFIIVLGIVVDDAIVTAENVHSKLANATNKLDAVVEGTKEVATPVTFGVITTIVAFIPLMFFEGHTGNIARQIPLVIIPVLIFSLIESKFILPGHLKHNYNILGKLNPFPYIHRIVDRGLNFVIHKIYRPTLKFCISFRHAVILGFLAILATTISYLFGPNMKLDTEIQVDRYIVYADIRLPAEAQINETHAKVLEITETLDQLSEEFMDGKTGKSLVRSVFSSTGGHNYGGVYPNRGYIYVEITPPSQRDSKTPAMKSITNNQIAARWREIVGEVEGVNRLAIRSLQSKSRAFDRETSIEFEIRGDNEANKAIIAEQYEQWAKNQEWASFASYDKGAKMRQLNFKVNQNGKDQGLTDTSLARQVRIQLLGEQAQRFQHGEDEIRVQVRLPNEERENAHALNLIRIKTKNGETSLKSVANFEETYGSPRIERRNGSRIIEMGTGLRTDAKSQKNHHIAAISKKMNELCIDNPGANWVFTGQVAKDRETRKRFIIGVATLVFVLFSLLAIPFKSIVQPIYVIIAVPLGAVGALLGHYHMDMTVSYLSMFGVLALCGVVVNDSLVIVDFINRKKAAGANIKDAIIDSGVKRFRAIMLTSITTFAGLYPIITETSIEATFLKPMAISLGFGIIYATLITLVLIPCAYMVGEDVKNYLTWFFTGKKTSQLGNDNSTDTPSAEKTETPASSG